MEHTNTDQQTGELRDALHGADVFIGVSAPNLLQPADLAAMAADPIVFALANPDPEVDPAGAREHGRGRPLQSPRLWRGLDGDGASFNEDVVPGLKLKEE